MKHITGLLAAAAVFAITGVAAAAGMMPGGVQSHKSDAGTTMLTLYTFDMDKEPGKSACNDKCATYWPAVTAAADAKPKGDWTIVARDDGAKQWAYKGKPLYTFMMDKKAGDTAGSEMGQNGTHVWHIATP